MGIRGPAILLSMPVNRRWQAAIGTVLLLWGCTSDNALTGPVEVEFERPWITIDSPAEGTIGDDGSVMVAGTFGGDVEGVSVNGVEATVEENTFSAEVSIDSEAPYTALLAEARGPGGWARDRQTYLRGGREAATATVPQGMALRLTDGGIDGLQGYVTSTVTPALVEQGIVDTNPLYSGDIVGTTVVLDATSASIDGLYLDLDARSNGVISQVTLTEISIAVELDTDWAGVWYGTVSLAALAMESRIRLTAEDGALVVEPRDVTVELFDLQIDFEGIWSWIEDGLESYVQSMMEETVAEAISQEVADALNGALAGLQSSFDFGTASIGGSFRDVVHDDDGINVQLDLELDATGDVPQYRVAMAGQPPEMSGSTTPGQQSYGAQVVLDDDALNAIGVAVYASGLMTQHLEGELPGEIPLELTASMFTTMFPSLEDAISPTAPLVVDTALGQGAVVVPLASAPDVHEPARIVRPVLHRRTEHVQCVLAGQHHAAFQLAFQIRRAAHRHELDLGVVGVARGRVGLNPVASVDDDRVPRHAAHVPPDLALELVLLL